MKTLYSEIEKRLRLIYIETVINNYTRKVIKTRQLNTG